MREKEAMQGNGVERYGLLESEIVGSERTNESLAKVCTHYLSSLRLGVDGRTSGKRADDKRVRVEKVESCFCPKRNKIMIINSLGKKRNKCYLDVPRK